MHVSLPLHPRNNDDKIVHRFCVLARGSRSGKSCAVYLLRLSLRLGWIRGRGALDQS